MTEKKIPLRRNDLLFPELSYTINGVLFDVFKQIGGGHQEKYYQKAVAISLKERQIKFQELGLIACFTTDGVFTKRIIHITKHLS